MYLARFGRSAITPNVRLALVRPIARAVVVRPQMIRKYSSAHDDETFEEFTHRYGLFGAFVVIRGFYMVLCAFGA
jgi:hypothetical protein